MKTFEKLERTTRRSAADETSIGGAKSVRPVATLDKGLLPPGLPGPSHNGSALPASLISGIASLSGMDLSDVQVHANSPHPERLDALAFAYRNEIHLAPSQERHLPHEAWHVVQQRQGRVPPTRFLGRMAINDNEQLESEANRMGYAAAHSGLMPSVPLGRSSNGSQEASKAWRSSSVAQCRLTVKARKQKWDMNQIPDSRDSSWARMLEKMEARAMIFSLSEDEQRKAREKLEHWIQASSGSSLFRGTKSEDRIYNNWVDVARALVGEIQSEDFLRTERTLSGKTQESNYIRNKVDSFILKLTNWYNKLDDSKKGGIGGQRGRYRTYYGTSGLAYTLGRGKMLRTRLQGKRPNNLNALVTLATDCAFAVHKVGELDGVILAKEHGEARMTHWNPKEGEAWTKEARENRIPLSAGPSATTAYLMHLGTKIAATPEELEAMAWALFSFFNQGLHLNKSGTHRFHEVMCVAKGYGVPYEEWTYPAEPPSEEGGRLRGG